MREPTYHVWAEATEAAFGGLAVDSATCRPLDTVTVQITGRAGQDTRCTIRVCDPEQQSYFESWVDLHGNAGEVQFLAAGSPGTHYIYLTWPGETKHSRYTNFHVDCETSIESGDADFDTLYSFTRDAMLRGRRAYRTPAGCFVGYISADTWHFDGIWLRDWIYGLPAYRYWEQEMTCGLDRFLEQQDERGMMPDGIERDGRTWRVGLESDVEYITVLGVWQTWKVTGDDTWLTAALPKLERALVYVRGSEEHWDSANELVKRQHSCDTWDFDIDGASDSGEERHVIATCDQSGYVLAFEAMSRMYAHLGNKADSERWGNEARAYRERANDLLWDGTKYLHHVHLDEIDHGDFEESEQLAMGNTWAMTRGLATADQARNIIDEYSRRHEETGDAYPWWSLQPGYPDHLGYFSKPHRRQGGYANGGLMPWVGGELCHAAFAFGRETYGVQLLRAYARHLRETGGAHVWYWPNGEPGFRTTNEVPYASWGMAGWLNAAVEGLAGVRDDAGRLDDVTISPRWTAAGVDESTVRVRYLCGEACLAYRFRVDVGSGEISLTVTGSGSVARTRILLPDGWTANGVTRDGTEVEYSVVIEGPSSYVRCEMEITGVHEIIVQCSHGR